MKGLKRVLLFILFAPILIVGGFVLIRWISFLNDDDPEKTFLVPKVKMKMLRATHLPDRTLNLFVTLQVYNSMPVGLKPDSIYYEIYADGIKLLESVRKEVAPLKAKDSSLIDLEGNVDLAVMDSLLKQSEKAGRDSAEYRLEGIIYSGFPFLKKFHVTKRKRLPLFFFPKFEIVSIERDSLEWSGVYLTARVRILNKNTFDFKSTEVRYRFFIEDQLAYESNKPDTLHAKAKSNSEEIFPVRIKLKDAGKALLNYIKEGADPDYTMELRLRSNAVKDVTQGTIVIVKKTGKLNELLKKEKERKRKKK
jgi:LEA14-like dessication related protein